LGQILNYLQMFQGLDHPPRLPPVGHEFCDSQVAHGLSALHANGGVHRNITAQNVYLDEKGRAKLGGYQFLKVRQCESRPAARGWACSVALSFSLARRRVEKVWSTVVRDREEAKPPQVPSLDVEPTESTSTRGARSEFEEVDLNFEVLSMVST